MSTLLTEKIMAAITHPEWCNGDHSDTSIQSTEDVFHMGDGAYLEVPLRFPAPELSFTPVSYSAANGTPGPCRIDATAGHVAFELTAAEEVRVWQGALRQLADDLEPLREILAAPSGAPDQTASSPAAD
ncbi:hypothetical protein [Streptomyces sp. NPDC037389]|uniref:DUF6907 domain-containing protein n=1 Tax=Streptomyces sp. NPDC037389 TaxID=3155369 RepID=UPI0033FE5A34